jgi:hypothetical protein
MTSVILPTPDDDGKVPAPDPFDPSRLRLSQDFAANLGVKKVILTIPVRKPDKAWFVRTHPDEVFRVETYIIELKEDRESYLVDPTLWAELATESTVKPQVLLTAVNRQGVLFLWPVPLPGPDGKQMEWHRSALEAATIARERWVRVQANMALGAYDVVQATGDLPDPKWPELSLAEILRIAFKGKLIDTLEHPVLRRLRGEI